MDEAAEDISCNIIPELFARPLEPPPTTTTSSPTSTIQRTRRQWMRLLFSAMTIFCSWGVRKEKLQAALLWPTLWVPEKRNTWVSLTQAVPRQCARARQNIESEPLWQSRPFLCLGRLIGVHSQAMHQRHMADLLPTGLCVCVCQRYDVAGLYLCVAVLVSNGGVLTWQISIDLNKTCTSSRTLR